MNQTNQPPSAAVASHTSAGSKKPGKQICYVLMIAKHFPATHPKKLHQTHFQIKINNGSKRHTIRANYDLWQHRMQKVLNGQAYISLRQWSGEPYRTKQIEIKKLSAKDGIGLQKLDFSVLGWFVDDEESNLTTKTIAHNDGLERQDFIDWFKDSVTDLAIIHFTNFRY
jgi:hypothetical protein